MKTPLMSRKFAVLVVFVLLCAAVWYCYSRNPLARYGVSFVETSGASESLNHIQFYRDYQGVRHKGPKVTGTWLFIVYQDINEDGISEIIVKSRAEKSHHVILRLNLSEDSKLPFEIVEHSLAVSYPELGIYYP